MNKDTLLITILGAILFGLIVIVISQSTTKPEPENVSISPVNNTPEESNVNQKKYSQAPELTIDQTKEYQAVLTTDAGDITIKLHASETPITVNNFVFLANEGFYNDTIFHRTINGFMIQGGDPAGNGTGGPGYRFADEDFAGEYTRGVVAMANSGPNTNGSQFFIMHQDYALQPNYVIFGEVVTGMEVVDTIATAPVTTSASGESSQPETPVTIQTVKVIADE